MARYDFRGPRLYVEAMLEADATVTLERAQAHYLGTVLRLRAGDQLLVFNGRDGEWSATIVGDRRPAALRIGARTRDQTPAADLHYLFAPLKAARLDYMTQKAVEMLGPLGYSRELLVEKWMRDAKINDIFEGTQQINMMIIARRILGYSSKELS